MNIDNARENLPLKKLTFTKYGEFRDDDNRSCVKGSGK